MRYLVLGIVVGIAAALIGVSASLVLAARGFSARAEPTGAERLLARTARTSAIPHDAKSRTNPTANTTEVLFEARAHWADHCALCHANNGSGDTEIGRGMYPHPPDMREASTQNMSDGELFYTNQNGVRLSGMPAWGGSEHTEEDSWKLVHFIRHLPRLTPSEEQEMQRLNPKAPDENEQQEHSMTQMHHHH